MGKQDEDEEVTLPGTTIPPEPAELAYNAYCQNRNWKAFNDDPLPLWVDVKDDIKAGWRAAADAVQNNFTDLRLLTDAEVDKMDLREAASQLGNRVYKVCLLYEQLEHRGRIRGNGHHCAQQISKQAEDLLRERWITPDPAPAETAIPTTKT